MRKPTKKKHRFIPIFLIIVTVLAAVIMTTMYMVIMKIANNDRIYPNTYIAGVDVSGMTEAEATVALQHMLTEEMDYIVSVYLPDQSLNFSMALGVQEADVAAAVHNAYQYGRESDAAYDRFRSYWKAQQTSQTIELTDSSEIDSDYIWEVLYTAETEIDTSSKESSVSIVENSIMIELGAPEKNLNLDELYTLVYDAFLYQNTTEIYFEYDSNYSDSLSIEDLYETMTFAPSDAYYDEATNAVVSDIPGTTPDIPLEAAIEMLNNSSPGDTLVFPFSYVEAEITTADLEVPSQGTQEDDISVSDEPETNTDPVSLALFQDVLATYTSTYDTDETNRAENIRLVCEAMNGTVIEPGDTFSFNDTVGERTAAKGYKEASVYVSGNTVNQVGGGICQAASNLYCCAMYADLEIVERTEHMFLVPYVPGGLDAAIYWGSLDLKFKNDTNYPIMIEANSYNGNCTISLLGTDEEHFTVEIVSECISSTPYNTIYMDGTGENISGYTGCSYQITRYIYDHEGNLIRTDTPSSLGSLGTSDYNKRDEVIYTN